jgi:hypothetical protein
MNTTVNPEVTASSRADKSAIESTIRAELGVSRPAANAAYHWRDIRDQNITKLRAKLDSLLEGRIFENGPTIGVVTSMLKAWESIPPELVREPAAQVTPAQARTQAQSQARIQAPSLEDELRAATGCKRPAKEAPVHFADFVDAQVRGLREWTANNPDAAAEMLTLALAWVEEWMAIPTEKILPPKRAPLNDKFPLKEFADTRNIHKLLRPWPMQDSIDVEDLEAELTRVRDMMKRIDAAGSELWNDPAFGSYSPDAHSWTNNRLAEWYADWKRYAKFLSARADYLKRKEKKLSAMDFNLDGRGAGAGSVESRKRKAAIADESRRIRNEMKNRAGKK